MKTKEELNALKNEVDTLKKKLGELSGAELMQVAGGFTPIAKGNTVTAKLDGLDRKDIDRGGIEL